MGSVLALLLSASRGESALSFADTVRMVIRVGGCNCSRANMVGACLGAAYGFQDTPFSGDTTQSSELGIPTDWLVRTDKGLEIFEMALGRLGSA